MVQVIPKVSCSCAGKSQLNETDLSLDRTVVSGRIDSELRNVAKSVAIL